MDEEETKVCDNCKRDIPVVNYTIHSVHCARNLRLCPVCKEPVPANLLAQHHDTLHTPLPCKQCGENVCGTDLEDHIRDSCGHTVKSCRYCELELPRRDLPAHESYCGTRTEQCSDCKEWVMLKYRQIHLQSNHGFIRLDDDPAPQQAKPEPPKASNMPKPTARPANLSTQNQNGRPSTSNGLRTNQENPPKNFDTVNKINNQNSHPYNASTNPAQPYGASTSTNQGPKSSSQSYNSSPIIASSSAFNPNPRNSNSNGDADVKSKAPNKITSNSSVPKVTGSTNNVPNGSQNRNSNTEQKRESSIHIRTQQVITLRIPPINYSKMNKRNSNGQSCSIPKVDQNRPSSSGQNSIPRVDQNMLSSSGQNSIPTVDQNRPSSSGQNSHPTVDPRSFSSNINGAQNHRMLKRTNDQPQVNLNAANVEKINKNMPSPRGAVKKRPAPRPPQEPPQREERDMALIRALQRQHAEQVQRDQQNQYNARHGLPPVLTAAEKLEKLRKMDALHNRETADDESWRNRLRGRVWMDRDLYPTGNVLGSDPSATFHAEADAAVKLLAERRAQRVAMANGLPPVRNDLQNLQPMSPEQFAERFSRLQLEGAPERARAPDRFSEIKNSLHALRRGLNEVTAPYVGNPSQHHMNYYRQLVNNNRPPTAPSPPPPPACDYDDEVHLPCEFCSLPVPAQDLVQHQTGCRPDLARVPPLRAAPPRSPPLPSDPYEDPVIPCEFCTESLPVYLIASHQEQCRFNYQEDQGNVYSDSD